MLRELLENLIVDDQVKYNHNEVHLQETIDFLKEEDVANFNDLKGPLIDNSLIEDMCEAIAGRDVSKAQTCFDALIGVNELNTEKKIQFLVSCYFERDFK